MKKFKTKQEVVDWYWPDFLMHCVGDLEYTRKHSQSLLRVTEPTIDNFWKWYITDGPLGVKRRNLFYTKTEVEYV